MTGSSALLLSLIAVAALPAAEPPAVRSLSFAPDGTLLAAGLARTGRGGSVIVWDVAKRRPAARYATAGEAPAATFSPDGKFIVVADGTNLPAMVDQRAGTKIGQLGPFPAEVITPQPAGDGRWLASCKDGVIRLWDAAEGRVTREFAGLKRVYSWAVAPQATWLFANGETGTKVWDLRSGAEVKDLFKSRRGLEAGTFLADDRLLVGTSGGSHRLIKLPSGRELLRFKNESGTGALVYSAAAGQLAGRYYGSTTVALTPLTLRPPTEAESTRAAALLKECDADDYATRERAAAALVALGPAVEPILRRAMADGPSAEVRMRARLAREAILNKPRHVLTGHKDDIRPMTFSPDGKLFATGAADGLVILWDPATGKELARLVAEGE